MSRVSVIGTGYVGLVTGVCLAEKGHRVICVDLDREKVDAINIGATPIYEPGLAALLQRNVESGIHATTDLSEAVQDTDLSIIAVGTPYAENGIDLDDLKKVSLQVGRALREKGGYHVVAVKSTVVPGTTDEVVLPLLEAASGKKAGRHFGVGVNPEFLREGRAVQDFMHPDRVVLGAMDEKTGDMLEELYGVFPGVDKIRTNNRTAEMIKYASNSLYATLISLSNEIANLCAALGGVDVVDVMQGVCLDRRLSPVLESGQRLVPEFTTYLAAGCGFGGSCLPKDVRALIEHARRAGTPMQLLDAVIRVNEGQPKQVLTLLGKHFDSLRGVRVAVLGLAFKPGTADMRESPAIPIVEALQARHAFVNAYDPIARHEAERKLQGDRIVLYGSLEEAISEQNKAEQNKTE